MSSAVPASCTAGVVTVGAITVVGATVLSAGVSPSGGVLLIDGETATYIASNASDINAMLVSLGNIIDKIITIVTALDAESTSPGGQTANIALLLALKTSLVAQKDILK